MLLKSIEITNTNEDYLSKYENIYPDKYLLFIDSNNTVRKRGVHLYSNPTILEIHDSFTKEQFINLWKERSTENYEIDCVMLIHKESYLCAVGHCWYDWKNRKEIVIWDDWWKTNEFFKMQHIPLTKDLDVREEFYK